MPPLIEQLAELIRQDRAILFVGADLRRELGEEAPSQLVAKGLAARMDYDGSDRSLAAVAQAFEDLFDRQELLRAVRQELAGLDAGPTALHRLLADAVLPSTKIITTWFDQVLERALLQVDKPYRAVVEDVDVTLLEEDQITVIKMQGDIERPESLLLTEEDLLDFLTERPTVSGLIRVYLATKHLIFLGYDLDSDSFQRLFREVNRQLLVYRRTAYAITGLPVSESRRRRWQKQGVEVCAREDLVGFLADLAQAVGGRPQLSPVVRAAAAPAESLVTMPPLPPRPYKALESYTGADAAIFSGRGDESRQLAFTILGRRLTLLYGESGSGKTSLLQAGAGPILPTLAKRNVLLAVATPVPDQPLAQVLASSLAQAATDAGLAVDALTVPLADQVRRLQQALDGPVVLAIDQCEQIFLGSGQAELAAAGRMLANLRDDETLDLRLVLVIREDFLGRLHGLERELPDLFAARFRLERLGRQEAEAAIVEPARLYDVHWEPALVQRLLDDLYERAGGGVAPPQLQIVCDQLYGAALARAGHDRLQITEALFSELGGTQSILGDYLDATVAGFADERLPIVRRLLAALVSSGRVKLRLSLGELARAAEADEQVAAELLDSLVSLRLVQRFQVSGPGDEGRQPQFELAHDDLVVRIARWLDDDYDFWATQKAREILRQGLRAWLDRGGLLSATDLSLVTGHAGRLRPTIAEWQLIYASATAYGHETTAAAEALAAADRRSVLLRLLQSDQAAVRVQAAAALGDLAAAAPDSNAALAVAAAFDPAPAVRRQAAAALASAGEDEAAPAWQAAIERLIAAASAGGDNPAIEALTIVRDRRPAAQSMLPEGLGKAVRRRVLARRWQRSRDRILKATLRGAQGGFWGLGLGFGLLLGPVDVMAAGQDLLPGLYDLIALMALGFPIAGLMGALAAGSGAFVAATLRSLQDRVAMLRDWALVTAVTALVLGLSFWPLAIMLAGDPNPGQKIAAGILIGVALAAPATAPFPISRWLRALITAIVAIVAFMVVGRLGWMFADVAAVWLILVGATSGVGFALGLSDRVWTDRMPARIPGKREEVEFSEETS